METRNEEGYNGEESVRALKRIKKEVRKEGKRARGNGMRRRKRKRQRAE
jgi:hypothetical protein